MALNRSIIQKEKNFWKQHKIKIASTLIAIFIWFLVVTRDSYEYKTTVPIFINQDNPDYVITSPVPEKAHIILQGSGRYLLSYMLFREARLILDVDWSSGRQIIRPTRENIFRSGNAKNLQVRQYVGPDSIALSIEKLITRDIPIQNNITIKPMAGYIFVGDMTMEPEVARVQGPEKAVAELDSIGTQTKVIQDQKFSFHETFSLAPPDNPQIKLLDTKVEIAVDIQQLLEKVITQVPVSVRYLPHNLEANVQPAYIPVKVQGGMQVVSLITDKDIDAYVEYSSNLDSLPEADLEVQFKSIPGVTIRNIGSDRVKVNLFQYSEP